MIVLCLWKGSEPHAYVEDFRMVQGEAVLRCLSVSGSSAQVAACVHSNLDA